MLFNEANIAIRNDLLLAGVSESDIELLRVHGYLTTFIYGLTFEQLLLLIHKLQTDGSSGL